MGLTAMGIWYGIAVGCTAWICYTDIRRYWISHGPVLALALGNGAAGYMGWVQPAWPVSFGVAAFFLLLYALWPGSLGSGDVKLALALAPGCSDWGAWVMLVTAFGLAALTAWLYWLWKGKKLIPFGPFLLAGWWIAQAPFSMLWPGGSGL